MAEMRVETVTAHGKNCVGCQTHQADMMISFTGKNVPNSRNNIPEIGVHDLFLNKAQVEQLYAEIGMHLSLEADDGTGIGK
jgi:hypothetical protein